MRIKKLDVFGFKSFASKQAINFGDGITCVVGPNGCGKSNVVDAIRWVMGEQNARHLRGGAMKDIIFCGSEKKAPLGFAEVSLTIDNNDKNAPIEYNHFEEIQITRRLYRNGDSEYEINKQRARLKDIVEFFLGTGVGTKAYSIIEQGRINEIILAKPIDRRNIIEEAAGITKYKAKKAKAERRIESTRANLNRIIDIKEELNRRIKILAQEKEKLKKAQELRQKIKETDLHLASQDFLAKKANLNFITKQNLLINEKIDNLQKEFDINESKFDKIIEQHTKANDERKLLYDLANQHKSSLDLLKKDIEHIDETYKSNDNLIARLTSQQEDLLLRSEEIEKNLYEQEQKKEVVQKELEEGKSSLQEKREEGNDIITKRKEFYNQESSLQKNLMQLATKAAHLQSEIKSLQSQDEKQKIEIDSLKGELKEKDNQINESDNRLTNLNNEQAIGQEKLKTLRHKLDTIKADSKSLKEQLSSIKQEKYTAQNELLRLTSRKKSLVEIEKSLEWSESGIDVILKSENKNLIQGVLADVIDVSKGYEEIVEHALCHLLDAGLIKSSENLASLSGWLKKNNASHTSFVLSSRNDQSEHNTIDLKTIKDVVDIIDTTHDGLNAIFDKICITTTLSEAIDYWPKAKKAHVDIVTMSGEMLFHDGIIKVRGNDKNKGILQRKREIADLTESIKLQENKTKKLEQDFLKLKSTLNEKNTLSQEINSELNPLERGLIRLEESIKQKRDEKTRLLKEQENLTKKLQTLKENLSDSTSEVEKKKGEWNESLELHKKIDEELEDLRAQKQAIEKDYQSHMDIIKTFEIKNASLKEKFQGIIDAVKQARINKDHVKTQEKNFFEQLESKKQEQITLSEKQRQAKKKVSELEKELSNTKIHSEKAQKHFNELDQNKKQLEQKLEGLKKEIEQNKQKIYKQEIKLNNINNEINLLIDRIHERYKTNLLDSISTFHDRLIDEKAAQKEIHFLKNSLEKIGSINENAAAEYDDLSKRATFLETQVNDLSHALNQLEAAIKKINKTTKMRFLESFNNINEQFKKLFVRLFNGGKAYLILTDEEDILNSGVDIIAKPPGKNIGSIDLMSGGEKALSAISLIMAIFLIKPSPFCLLDEVDAPLDEANVSRFSQLIKEMSARSQFIVITHNRKTMECADQLYGVTMEEAGSSKMVSVHVEEAFQALRQDPKKDIKKPAQLSLNDVN